MKKREKSFFKACKRLGVKKVSELLGYSSKHTIYHWINNQKIPPLAWDKVDQFLQKEGL